MNPRYLAVAARAGHRCEYCLAPEAAFNLAFEVEHIVPPGRGGSNELPNLALACRACNLFKSDRVEAADPLTGTLVRLFDPRLDHWDDHFCIMPDAEIQGRTEFGRATAQLLPLNAVPHTSARQLWLRIGIYAVQPRE